MHLRDNEMKYCYHTHTARCHHASGEDEEYVKAAVRAGVRVLGFSDHAPMPYPDGYVSYYKMTPDELEEYCSSITYLREKYKDKIEILIGLETEYYPELWEKSIDFWRDYPIDYLILGQHFIRDEGVDPSIRPSDEEGRVKSYVDNVITAMRTGLITYVAHPDLINYAGEDEDFYVSEIKRLINESVRLGMPLEYNLLGMATGRAYPRELFWQTAGALGATAVIGCDAHDPTRVAKIEELDKAHSYLDGLGITVTDEVRIRKLNIK